MKKSKKSRWSEKDIRLLKKLYGELPIEELQGILGKTESAIRSKVHYLRKRGWSFTSTRR